jgi:hypothetical protein
MALHSNLQRVSLRFTCSAADFSAASFGVINYE